MTEQPLARLRPQLIAMVLIAEVAHLGWEHFKGGVVSHNILERPDLPAISNVWGLLFLPALTWFVIGRVQKRLPVRFDERFPGGIVIGLIAALAIGIALAVSFSNGYSDVTRYIFRGILLLTVLLPFYRAECILGFVLGMTFTFGAVLPMAVAAVIGAISAFIHLVVRRGIASHWARFRPTRSTPS